MPELPEVEAVRRLMRRALGGKVIVRAEVAPDEIVLQGLDEADVEAHLKGNRVLDVGRKGKYWWLELEQRPWLFGHLGMAGWIREIGGKETRLREHGKAPLVDESGRPRFLKLFLESDDGRKVAFTDGRRLARMWLGDGPEADPRVSALGPDAYESLPKATVLAERLGKRRAPIKAVLMDQAFLSGIGNWIADEVLYHARIAPKRHGADLSAEEVERLHATLRKVLKKAVEVEADYEQFPKNWLFHHRWGGGRGADEIDGRKIVREAVGGRTTAWVPDLQN
jgi:formamidopyrimidine-DNA glycosylase